MIFSGYSFDAYTTLLFVSFLWQFALYFISNISLYILFTVLSIIVLSFPLYKTFISVGHIFPLSLFVVAQDSDVYFGTGYYLKNALLTSFGSILILKMHYLCYSVIFIWLLFILKLLNLIFHMLYYCLNLYGVVSYFCK